MPASPLLSLFTSFLATLGFGVLLRAPGRALPWAALAGAAAHGAYRGLAAAGLPEEAAIFLAALLASFLSELLARRMRMAATVFVTPSIIPLVPGLALYRAMAFLAQGESKAGLELGVVAMASFLMIALGVAMGSFLWRLLPGRPPASGGAGEG